MARLLFLVLVFSGCSLDVPDAVARQLDDCGWAEGNVPELADVPPDRCIKLSVRSQNVAITNGRIPVCEAREHAADLQCATGTPAELRIYGPRTVGAAPDQDIVLEDCVPGC